MMISKAMYTVLSKIPRFPDQISFQNLQEKIGKDADAYNMIVEAKSKPLEFVNQDGTKTVDSNYSLTESGQGAIEEYEQNEENLKLVRESLKVANVAKWAAIASAVTAFISLIPQLPSLICFFQHLFQNVQ